MRKTFSYSLILTTLLATSAIATAEAPKSTSQPKAAEVTKKPPAIDPKAIDALKKMGGFLREQQNFSVRTKTETDMVLESGQKVRTTSNGELKVRRPDHLRADMMSTNKQRQFFYDGKTFTLFSPQTGFYSVVDAPPTILRLADLLEDRYGMELPLVDLFRWGSDEQGEEGFSKITSATFVGTTKIDGVDTDQYAFRQPGVDWQIWIERGDRPVPRKLLLTTTDDDAQPEHSVEMTWNLNSKTEDAAFAFVPPKDSAEIAMADVSSFREQHSTATAEGAAQPESLTSENRHESKTLIKI